MTTIETINQIKLGDSILIAPLANTLDENCNTFDSYTVILIHKKSIVLKGSNGKTRERQKTSLLWEVKNGLAKI